MKILRYVICSLLMISCNNSVRFSNFPTKPNIKNEDQKLASSLQPFKRQYKVSEKLSGAQTFYGEQKPVFSKYQYKVGNTRSMSFFQKNRLLHTETHVQGLVGENQEEEFPLTKDGALDLLIVVDNSQSMEIYQERLAERFEPLLKHIGHTDWQIAVVTTDRYCRQNFGQVLTREEYLKNPTAIEALFRKAITAGTHGHPVERGIEMAIKGMRGDCGGDWVREVSKKAVLLISDEENCGSAPNEGPSLGCPGAPKGFDYFGPEEFVKELGGHTRFYGILYDKNQCSDNFYDVQPQDYYDLVTKTNGIWGLICQNDYSNLLSEISKDVGEAKVRQFELKDHPDNESLVALIDGQLSHQNISLDGETVTLLGNLPSDAHFVKFLYTSGSELTFERLPIKEQVDLETLEVFVDDKLLGDGEFSLSFENGKGWVEFLPRPSDKSVVDLKYKRINDLHYTFALMKGIEPSSVRLFSDRDQPEGQEYWYDEVSDSIVFSQPPKEGQRFDVEFNLKSDYEPLYLLPKDYPIGNGVVELHDIKTGELIYGQVEGIYFRIPLKDISDGRVLQLTYEVPYLANGTFILPSKPIKNSVRIFSRSCSEFPKLVKHDAIELDCWEDNLGTLEIKYAYYSPKKTSFDIGTTVEDVSIQVEINGREVERFRREKNLIWLDSSFLDHESTVTISVDPLEKEI